MPSRGRLDWNADALVARLAEAARLSIDEVTAEAAADASVSHSWVNRDGQLEEEIKTESARVQGSRVIGRFGTTRRRGFYGLFHEKGTVHEFERPFLRPAGDRAFPTLAAKIRRKVQ